MHAAFGEHQGDELIANGSDALVADDPFVASEDRDQVAQEVEEQLHRCGRPVRLTRAAAGRGDVAVREQRAVAVEQHPDPVVLESVERLERMDDEVDVQPVGRDPESTDEPGDRIREYGRPGDLP